MVYYLDPKIESTWEATSGVQVGEHEKDWESKICVWQKSHMSAFSNKETLLILKGPLTEWVFNNMARCTYTKSLKGILFCTTSTQALKRSLHRVKELNTRNTDSKRLQRMFFLNIFSSTSIPHWSDKPLKIVAGSCDTLKSPEVSEGYQTWQHSTSGKPKPSLQTVFCSLKAWLQK